MTLALLETHRLDGDLRPVRALSHRVSAPLFCGQSAQLVATPTPTGTTVEVIGPGGEEAGPRTTVELTLT
jgi:3-methylfumaryl-CoA hydratase